VVVPRDDSLPAPSGLGALGPEQPTLERRSRVKRMRGNFYPPYRLRVGDFRVYYDVDERRSEVLVLHVWEKGRRATPHAVGPTGGRKA